MCPRMSSPLRALDSFTSEEGNCIGSTVSDCDE